MSSPLLHFAHRATPDAAWTDLNPDLIAWPQQIRVASEENMHEFRASQIEISLSELRQTYNIQGGDEIAVFSGPPPAVGAEGGPPALWSGTVDPAEIKRDEITHRLTLRVLQHGSTLNTIYAGLPDWVVESDGSVTLDPSKPYRYRGNTDNWKPVAHPDGTFDKNEIESENAEVFLTPSAFEDLTDVLYKSQFAKTHLYHSAHRFIGQPEYPFPNRSQDGNTQWLGPFEQHYRPNFDMASTEWDNQQSGIVAQPGGFLRTKDPQRNFTAHQITDILSDLVNQFNRTARFPINFDPATDAVIIPPQLEQAIELLIRSPEVESVDLYPVPWTAASLAGSLLVLLNHTQDIENSPVRRFSVYRVTAQYEVIPIEENKQVQFNVFHNLQTCFPAPNQYGFRFARTGFTAPSAVFSTIPIYSMRWRLMEDNGPLRYRFEGKRFRVTQSDFLEEQILGVTDSYIDETLNETMPREVQTSRALSFSIVGAASGLASGPELPLQESATIGGAQFRAQNGGLAVTGIALDRVAFDCENTRISSLISDLAKLTHSRWWVTSDRRLKFISRQISGTPRTVSSASLRRPFLTYTKTFEKEPAPTISSALILADNIRQGLETWFEDNVQPSATVGGSIAVTRSDLPTLELNDEIILTGEPNIGAPAVVKHFDMQGENTLLITTEQIVSL